MRSEPALQPLELRFDSRSARSKTLLKSANKDKLRRVLTHHVVAGRVVAAVEVKLQSVGQVRRPVRYGPIATRA
ncbi:hypothetical protein LuPra_05094 [Luteitalea pratensis]|uniref:Uncharacterized protein n=1 Tax=Luteitalea pratensis TaxID=1855912 RepID=A0A143PVL0_LUTPR|nr:hypothetical protein [Luteitalea pratensis]AMY11829.1 hypothetical protein LuPra_05094 [Luteitalea pratensis]